MSKTKILIEAAHILDELHYKDVADQIDSIVRTEVKLGHLPPNKPPKEGMVEVVGVSYWPEFQPNYTDKSKPKFKIGDKVEIYQLWFDFGIGTVKEILPKDDNFESWGFRYLILWNGKTESKEYESELQSHD